jgi:L-ascorbate metabolism protein UlaG (beta-lactamase superfamily)
MKVTITQIDTACLLIDINGFKILTDPAFDEAGSKYLRADGKTYLHKTGSPAIASEELGPIDLVLLSHHQHKDNLDNSGLAFIKTVPGVISTKEAVEQLQLDNVYSLEEWESLEVEADTVEELTITATPCQHASTKEVSAKMGHVIGFIIEWKAQENGVLYISGDTVLFEGVRDVAERFLVNTAIVNVGKAGIPASTGDVYYTFTADEAIEVAEMMHVDHLIPTHWEGWDHFQEKSQQAMNHFAKSLIAEKVIKLEPGKAVEIDI